MLSPLDFVTYAEIYDNDIMDCGLYDFEYADDGANGEGICELVDYNPWYCGNIGVSLSQNGDHGVNVHQMVTFVGSRTFEIHTNLVYGK